MKKKNDELNALEKQNANINKLEKNKVNKSLNVAKAKKDDEYYTKIEDIEKEMKNYRKYFKEKTIFLNCDDPEWSNFFRYFYDQFHFLNLKKLISTHYSNDKKTYKVEVTSSNGKLKKAKKNLKENGDFRSDECIELLKESDIVITNPPFSLFREYVSQLFKYKKKFIIMGDSKAISYKQMFPLVKENKIWIGFSGLGYEYYRPIPGVNINLNDPQTYETKKLGFTCWYSNIGKPPKREHFALWERYKGNEPKYVKLDNYDDVIFISKFRHTPFDYDGLMAIPPTAVDKLDRDRFEIIGELGTSQETFDNYNNMNTYIKFKNGELYGGLIKNKNPIIPSSKEDANMYCPKRKKYFKRTFNRILVKNLKVGQEG